MRALRSLSACLLLFACGGDSAEATRGTDGGALAQNNRSDGAVAAAGDAGGTQGRSDGGSTQPVGDAGPATAPTSARYFPAASWMYQRIDGAALDPDSATVTTWLQNNGGWGTG